MPRILLPTILLFGLHSAALGEEQSLVLAQSPPGVRENYKTARGKLESWRKSHATAYRQANNSGKAKIREIARKKLLEVLQTDIFPAWYGTTWDFNGISQTPGEGKIACGYFVSTCLRDAGFNVPRIRMAQQPSQRIIGQYLNGLGLRCLSVDRVRTAEEFLSSSKDGEAFDYVMVGLPVEHFDEELLEAWLQDYFIDQRSKILIMIPEAFQGIRFYGFHSLIHILKEPIYPKDLLHALVHTTPVSKVQEEEEIIFSEPADSVAKPTGIRVLVVDDHEINRIVIQEMLQKNGYEVSVAEDGEIALEKLSGSKFDVVFMDVQMPVRDGLSTCKAIREGEKSTSEHLPVAGMTAGVTEKDRKNCLEAGMDAYLGKPITEKALLISYQDWLNIPVRISLAQSKVPPRSLLLKTICSTRD